MKNRKDKHWLGREKTIMPLPLNLIVSSILKILSLGHLQDAGKLMNFYFNSYIKLYDSQYYQAWSSELLYAPFKILVFIWK